MFEINIKHAAGAITLLVVIEYGIRRTYIIIDIIVAIDATAVYDDNGMQIPWHGYYRVLLMGARKSIQEDRHLCERLRWAQRGEWNHLISSRYADIALRSPDS